MQTQIGVKLVVPGFHFWKDAPEEVSFLRHNHRHLFGIECIFEVNHQDRQLEFFIVQQALRKHLDLTYEQDHNGYQFGAMSCEMIAQELLDTFSLISCKVDEDGENFGIVCK